MLHGFNFSKLFFLPTLVFTHSKASNCHILQHHGPTLQVCGAHPIKLIVTWLVPDRAIKKKITRGLKDSGIPDGRQEGEPFPRQAKCKNWASFSLHFDI